jgi:hypothetical protein
MNTPHQGLDSAFAVMPHHFLGSADAIRTENGLGLGS